MLSSLWPEMMRGVLASSMRMELVDGHIVPQVIEAHLVVGAVGDVRIVCRPALVTGEAVDDQTHVQAQEAVDLAHPLAVALGQIVVDRDHVDALSLQGVQVTGQHGDEGLALAGLHLGNAPLVEHQPADELHRKGLHAQHAPGRLPGGGKGLRQQVVQGLSLLQPPPEFRGLGLELLVAQRTVLVLQGEDPVHDGAELFQLALGIGTENLIQKSHVLRYLLLR